MAKIKHLFFSLLLLTGFFILIEVSFFIQCNSAYFNDLRIASDNLAIPFIVLPGILYFLFAQLFVHLSYCLLIFLITIANADFFKLNPIRIFYLGIIFWLCGLLTILVANCYYFPNSKFAELMNLILINAVAIKIVLFILCGICCVAAIPLLFFFPRFFLVAVVFIAVTLLWSGKNSLPQDAATSARPNIIIIGIDSLRPDFLSFFGGGANTPFFDAFLQRATVFSEALTPIARTYPSWTAILTGKYPRESGVRFNLPKKSSIDYSQTLPFILKQNNYQTWYATDETRFSNIDQQFGFEKIITPPMGLNDFLLGTLNDFPISNLLVNTFVGKWLFPYSYANRPVYFTYQPDSFIEMLKPTLLKNRDRPIFLAVHFCLPHHPYLWSDYSAQHKDGVERYKASIKRVDQQLQDFFTLLERYQFLRHAIVIVLSDHGEALALEGDRITHPDLFLSGSKQSVEHFYPPTLVDEKVNQSVGHGTDVLGISQYHSLLAFRFYNTGNQEEGIKAGRVSLLNIKPTVLSLLGLSPESPSNHAVVIPATSHALQPRHFFLESDFSPAALRTVYPNIHQVLLEGIGLFEVNSKTGRLQVKDEMGKRIINSKQYADIYGEWELALYPQADGKFVTVLINLRTGLWTQDLHSRFAKNSPVETMRSALKVFYAEELSTRV